MRAHMRVHTHACAHAHTHTHAHTHMHTRARTHAHRPLVKSTERTPFFSTPFMAIPGLKHHRLTYSRPHHSPSYTYRDCIHPFVTHSFSPSCSRSSSAWRSARTPPPPPHHRCRPPRYAARSTENTCIPQPHAHARSHERKWHIAARVGDTLRSHRGRRRRQIACQIYVYII